MSVKEQLDQFYTYLLTQKRVSKNTFLAYKADLGQFLQFIDKNNLTAQSLSSLDIKLFLRELKDQNLAARSMARKISSLKLFFAFAHERNELPDLGQDLIFPRVDKKLPHILSEEEIQLFLEMAAQDTSEIGVRNKTMLYLLYVSGLRISELINLEISDVRWDTGFLHVNGKGGKQRMIPLPAPMMVILNDYMKKNHLNAKDATKKSNYLFPICYAGALRPITRQAMWGIVKQVWRRTGIAKPLSPHQLRHSLATHLLKRGADLRSLQMLLGHENLSTVQIYTQVETSYLRTVYDKKHPRS